LAVAEQELDMIRKGEAVMEEELMEEKLKSRLFVPDLLSHIPFETRSLNPYPEGFFKTVIQKEYARASQKQIRKDLSDLASTPALRSKSSAKKRSATPTDRVRCSDPVDSSASCCRECGLGGGVLLVTHQSTLHFCHSVNVFLAGMLQAELRRPFTSYMLRPRPGGPPQTIRVSPLQKPASKNEITSAVYRLHCCGISG
jgi:hypothetical protein